MDVQRGAPFLVRAVSDDAATAATDFVDRMSMSPTAATAACTSRAALSGCVTSATSLATVAPVARNAFSAPRNASAERPTASAGSPPRRTPVQWRGRCRGWTQ